MGYILWDIRKLYIQPAMPYSIRPSEHKPFQADTARWKNFRSRLTVWQYRMSSVLHQGVHGHVKIIPMLPSSVVWLVGFFGSWRYVVCQGRICESNWKHQHVWYSSAYILRWTYVCESRKKMSFEERRKLVGEKGGNKGEWWRANMSKTKQKNIFQCVNHSLGK